MSVHRLKTWREPFLAIRMGLKPFEYRSEDDRRFEVGDLLLLEEWDEDHGLYTGNACHRLVTFVLRDAFGVPPGFAVLGLNVIGNAERLGIRVFHGDRRKLENIERDAVRGAA